MFGGFFKHNSFSPRNRNQKTANRAVHPQWPRNSLNYALASRYIYHPHKGAEIRWDLRNDPYNPPLRCAFPPFARISQSVFHEPATYFPMRFVRIKLQPSPTVSFYIDVHDDAYVTVGHVLEAVYRVLREPLSESQWGRLSDVSRCRVWTAFHERCSKASHPDYESYKGMKKIDLLGNKTLFQGLETSNEGPYTWNLNLS
ncbi:hypothetical protein DFH11DRAFT_536959 [Phellopilus nigrolimitatus]|nr:hypothetical protein DFH11DRAFT_536959 [Phellopilus nigrolimitatus]